MKNVDLLKKFSPHFHRWMHCEWNCESFDFDYFAADKNNFQSNLYERFPNLKTKQLTRIEWNRIRRLLKRRRRFSSIFVLSERRKLERWRRKKLFLQENSIEENEIFDPIARTEKLMALIDETKKLLATKQTLIGVLSAQLDDIEQDSSVEKELQDAWVTNVHEIHDQLLQLNQLILNHCDLLMDFEESRKSILFGSTESVPLTNELHDEWFSSLMQTKLQQWNLLDLNASENISNLCISMLEAVFAMMNSNYFCENFSVLIQSKMNSMFVSEISLPFKEKLENLIKKLSSI